MKALKLLRQHLEILELSRQMNDSDDLISEIFKYKVAIIELEVILEGVGNE